MNVFDEIRDHYRLGDLSTRILTALRTAGKDTAALTLDDIASFDEFHFGGYVETRALAELATLRPETRVLDVGCGIGGPARRLAADFGCRVTGLDLTEDFCQAGAMLTDLVGLTDKVSFRLGSALEMPFGDSTFDVVWMQHVSMNIKDKSRLFGEIRRVLHPGGRLVFHEVMAGPGSSMRFPVFWANAASLSFLDPPEIIMEMLTRFGFNQRRWVDVSARAESLTRKRHQAAGGKPSPLGLGVIVDRDVPEKISNSLHNLEQKNIVVVQGVFDK